MLVPALLTSGSAKHLVPPAHGVTANLPPTHCANPPSTHACLPSAHEESALRPANSALRFWASLPFWSVKGLAPGGAAAGGCSADLGGAGAGAGADLAGAGEGAGGALSTLLSPFPWTPPVAPVAAMRASASCCVVQAILVPALLTRGRAKH